MCPLHSLYEQAHFTILLSYGGVERVGEGAMRSVAETCYGVWVFAELFLWLRFREGCFEGAELVIDNRPNHFIVLHGF